jgi:hypothetical protein
MFTIAYSKQSKKIVFARYDQGPTVAVDFYFNQHCEINNLDKHEYIVLEYAYDKTLLVEIGKHIFNPVTGLIEVDPLYIAPAPVEPTVATE